MKRILFFFFLLPTFIFSQKNYFFQNFTIEDGLSQSAVTSIGQDENYAIWIGTQDGLNRFDGRQFDIFTTANTPEISNDYIRTIFKAKDKKLWFGTQDGIFNYNSHTERFTRMNYSSKNSLQVECMEEDDQRIWIGSYGNGLLYINHKDTTIHPFFKQQDWRHISSITPLDASHLLISSNDQLGIINLTTRKVKEIQLPINTEISSIVKNQQKLFVGTNKGIFIYRLESDYRLQLEKRFLKDEQITALYFDGNYYFIGTANNGLFTVHLKDGEMIHSLKDRLNKSSLSNNAVNVIFKDRSDAIWIGTNNGISDFNLYRNNFNLVTTSEYQTQGIPNTEVWCFEENGDGRIIFIGTTNSVSFYNRAIGKFTHCPLEINEKGEQKKLKNAEITSIRYVNEDLVLVATTNGLFELHYNNGNPSFKRIKISGKKNFNDANRIYTIVHYKEDIYFLGTKEGVIKFHLLSGKQEYFYHDLNRPEETIIDGICRVIYKDRQGNIHFFTSEGGMSTYDARTNQIHPSQFNNLLLKKTKDYVTSALQIGNDYWFGTLGAGVLKLNTKTKKITQYDHRNGLPNNVIYGLIYDREDGIWMSSNRGLFRINIKNNNLTTYSNYSESLMREYNLGAYFISKSGEMFFGGVNGYNSFFPDNIKKMDREIKVSIVSMKISGKEVFPSQKGILHQSINTQQTIHLHYKQNNVSFQIMSDDPANAKIISYKYVLEGENNDEVLLDNQSIIHFSNLQPGKYTLKIYARIGNSKWNQYPKILHLEITPPFWKALWFWLLFIFIGILFSYFYIRYRIELSRRQQVILEMRIAERTREIRDKSAEIEKQGKVIAQKNKRLEVQKQLLQNEKIKTDKILRNILPEATFNEIMDKGKVAARSYKKVSVMFTDFVGFTKISTKMSPAEIVEQLDVYFTEFDRITGNYNLEKIKTIGDAYMCAGGIPIRNKTNPIESCLAGLKIQQFVLSKQKEQLGNGEVPWKIRLGINTGEITAGIIGKKKLSYDIWGSTVNMANRMEMTGEPDEVTISGETYKYIQYYFDCDFKRKVLSKSNDIVDVYTVKRIKKELSKDVFGLEPNDKFWQLVNLHLYSQISYRKAEKHVIQLLEKNLPDTLHYHSIFHTFDVVEAAGRIALEEGVTDENLFLLKSAALLHDAGFTEQYERNEPIGARLAKEILPDYGYSPEQIAIIQKLIYVTQIPHHPTNLIEQIICDADLDYLGRDDFFEISDKLRVELREHGKLNSDRAWDEIQVKFLTQHRYFTQTAIRTRRAKKQEHIEIIKNKLKTYNYPD